MATNNAINLTGSGITKYDGAGTFSAVTVTQYNALIGSSSNGITSVAPGTTGIPLVSQGAASNPAFSTCAVAGGGLAQSTYTTGDIIYASAANTLSKLAIGSSGHALTLTAGLPGWAAQSGGGGVWTYLTSATASASATLDFTTVITSTYLVYAFVIDKLLPATDAQNFYFRTSTDNGVSYDSGASDYEWALDGNQVSTSDTADSVIRLTENCDSATAGSMSGVLMLYNPSSATSARKHITYLAGHYENSNLGAVIPASGARIATADVDAVRFYYASGNIASGTIYLYGVAKTS